MTAVWWIRRDMRLADNGALVSAAARGAVVPLFVWEDNLLAAAGEIRRAFVFEALRSLDSATGGRLVYRVGPAVDALPEFCRLVGADSVHITEDFAPWGRARDRRVERALSGAGVELVRADTPYAIAPGTVRKDDGTPLRVFTPFYKRWLTHEWRSHPDADVGFADHGDLSVGPRGPGGWSAVSPQPASEAAAWDRFESWSERALGAYKQDRNSPALDGTSMLSAHLKFGIIHPRQLLQRLDASAGADHFRSEIAWREFYADVLFHLPHTTWQNLQPKMDSMRLDTDAAAEARFDRFCRGETGYPIVDAGIRQMLGSGWMHNRVRMIVASFLVKDLHLPWQWGARFFMERLVDADIASNNHGWQWTAGTGTDAAPYFRVFNPVSQGQKFDPTGEYVRRWVPELAEVDTKHIHEPWTLGVFAPADYPAPMVDHAVERDEALARYKAVTGK
ncbi:MAG: deoxyribodipyrimidine photo-lyase [Actinobacteria bacterium]|nr:deoxyribodipyrimidine photo-lyase [Actinomycetota bacterium]